MSENREGPLAPKRGRSCRQALFSGPVVSIPAAADHHKMTYPSARNAVMHLVDAGILEGIDARKRGTMYAARGIPGAFS